MSRSVKRVGEQEQTVLIGEVVDIEGSRCLCVLPSMVGTAIQYIGIRTRLNFITGTGVTVLCLLLDIEYPLLWGMIPSRMPSVYGQIIDIIVL